MDVRVPLCLLVGWLIAAIVFTAVGGLRVLPPPFPQSILFVSVVLLAIAYARRPSFRSWVDSVPLWWILAFHLSRFVGVYFLVLYERGELPYDFAVLGGWGDIVVAVWALGLLIVYSGRLRVSSLSIQAWNLFGLIDILLVVSAAVRNILVLPESMAPLTVLPLGLLPIFLVPLIIFSHGVVLYRGLRERAA